ncbi:ABC transporter permease [Mycoplasmopsis pulmonis]|uniref:ABC transporter permease n=1 Tax=Mycoplasmopsis pulmonis TaxID=2107 RepID=UPI001005244D|nr:FtsX-like permease family protein [Mycoplasmopsis pulmonis]VEU68536.1 Uncharacterized ABC transporter permease MG468 homolog [Mycoplasmopsis pulmonis]
MFKILKEVFKSLAHNKVTVIGLSILVFLTSGIFTLLFDVKNSYQRQFDSYSKISKNHDLTVDLDLKTNGKIPSSGIYNKAIEEYKLSNPNQEKKKILDFSSNYILASKYLEQNDPNLNSLYIKASYLENLYNNTVVDSRIAIDKNKNSITFLSDQTHIPLYELKSNGDFVQKQVENVIKKDTKFTFDSPFFLREIAEIKNKANDNDFLASIGGIYLNLKTKQATVSLLKSIEWRNRKELYVLSSDQVAKILGFSKNNVSGFYEYDKSIQVDQSLPTIASEDVENKKTNINWGTKVYGSFSFPFVSDTEEIKQNSNKHFNPQKGYEVALDSEIIKTYQNEVFFKRHKYTLNYPHPDWNGTTKEAIEQILADAEKSKKFKSFSYWEKRQVIKINGKNHSEFEEVINTLELIKDLKKVNPSTQDLAIYTIKSIENFSDEQIRESNFLYNLSNKRIENQRTNEIIDLSNSITKQNVIDKVSELAGKESLGLRQTISIDSVSEQSERQTFHFVNTGDKDNVINGIKQNVGRLYDEHFNPSKLNTLESNDTNFFRSEEIPSSESGKITTKILDNFHVDKNFLIVDLLYKDISYVDLNGSYRTSNQKIVLIKNVNEEKKFSEGIVKIDNSYYHTILDNNKFILDIKKPLTKDELDLFFIEKNKTISSTKVGDTWARPLDSNKSKIALPFIFRAPRSDVIKEINNQGTFELFLDSIYEAFRKSDLVTRGFISKANLDKMYGPFKRALYNNKFHSVLSSGSINSNIYFKMFFDWISEINKENGNTFFNDVILDFTKELKRQIKEGGATTQQQKDFIVREFKKFDKIFGSLSTTGKLFSALFLNLEVYDIFTYIKDPVKFIEGFEEIIKSIDFTKATSEIGLWYEQNWQKHDQNNKYILLSEIDVLLSILDSADQNKVRLGMGKIVSEIDFNKFLNPEEQDSIYSRFKKIHGENQDVKNFFNKLDGSKEGQEKYSNVSKGLVELISFLDIKSFVARLKQNSEFKLLPKIPNNPKEYKTNSISSKNLWASFLDSIFHGQSDENGVNLGINNDAKIKSILVEMFNISDAGEFLKISDKPLYIPSFKDDKKVGLGDLSVLQSLPQLFASQVDKSKEVFTQLEILNQLDQIKNSLLQNRNLSESQVELLKKYLPLEQDFNFEDKNNVIEHIDANYLLTNQFRFNSTNSSLVNFSTIAKRLLDAPSNHEAYNLASKQLKDSLGSVYEEFELSSSGLKHPDYKLGKKAISLLALFIRLRKESLSIENYQNDYKKIFDFINTKSDDENAFVNVVNSKTLYKDVDDNFDIAGFGISKGLASTSRLANELFEKEAENYKNKEIQKFLDSLTNEARKLIEENKEYFIQIAAILLSFKEYHPTLLNIFEYEDIHRNNFFKYSITNPVFENKIALNELNKQASAAINQSKIIYSLGLSYALVDPMLNILLPQVALWFTSSLNTPENSQNKDNKSNLAYLITNKVVNLGKMNFEQIQNFVSVFLGNSNEGVFNNFENDAKSNLFVDLDYLELIGINENSRKKNDEQELVFGINFKKTIYEFIDAVTYPHTLDNVVVFNDVASYLVKVNQAYLVKNNKTIYTGEIPTNNKLFNEFLLKNKDESWMLNVNGSQFIIVGTDTTSDYLYPVVDENNLQVNTSQQAIVYVNQKGFERVKTFSESPNIKEYILVKAEPKKERLLADQIESYISQQTDQSVGIKKTYLNNEIDPINPERSIRVATPRLIISSVSNFNFYIIIILITLVAISIIFIVHRYIKNKSLVIGILIFQGYSPLQISLSMTVFAMFTAVFGGVFGYVVGNNLQGLLMNVFSNFWTLERHTEKFSIVSLMVAVFLPFLGMSILIILTSLWILRKKPIDLMSGITAIKVGSFSRRINRLFSKRNVKTKFSASLLVNSFFKLLSLAFAITITSTIIMFGISINKVFSKSIDSTYKNRHYSFKLNLATPTLEGGPLTKLNYDEIKNSLYVPLGTPGEANLVDGTYFKPGWSNAINGDRSQKNNGDPKDYLPHVFSAFSMNIIVEGAIRFNLWDLIYNSLPDTQKFRVDKIVSEMGKLLEQTQFDETSPYKLIQNPENGNFYYGSVSDPKNYFKYFDDLQGVRGFFYMRWNAIENTYNHEPITTSRDIFADDYYGDFPNQKNISLRNVYRQFLVRAYTKLHQSENHRIAKELEEKGTQSFPREDYFLSLGGVVFDQRFDETYSYASANFEGTTRSLNIYGYKSDSKFIKIIDENDVDLMQEIAKFETKTIDGKKVYPVVVNTVSSKKYKLGIGSTFGVSILNKATRYSHQIKQENFDNNVIFEVVGINPTFINEEFITSQEIVNEITDLNKIALRENQEIFNGILTSRDKPAQLIGSSSIYSASGYWPAITNFEFKGNESAIYDAIFDESGPLRSVSGLNLSEQQILRWLNSNASSLDELKNNESQRDAALQKYAQVYGSLYASVSSSIDSKDVESGFVTNISSAVNNLTVAILIISLIISVIILVIISVILIAENEKNIAIFAILGYNNKERLILFFSIFVPFIIFAILLSSVFVLAIIFTFNFFLINAASIALPLSLKFWHMLVTFLAVAAIISVTSIFSWIGINKIKPIMLLKGK